MYTIRTIKKGVHTMCKYCEECFGDGRINIEVDVGGYYPDRWVGIDMKNIECPKCEGTGVEQIEEDE
jgi:hypothetical protein